LSNNGVVSDYSKSNRGQKMKTGNLSQNYKLKSKLLSLKFSNFSIKIGLALSGFEQSSPEALLLCLGKSM